MIIADVDASGLQRGLAALVRATKIEAPRILRKETGELVKTLVRLSPPSNLAKSKARLEGRVNLAFEKLAENVQMPDSAAPQQSKAFPGLVWYSVDEKALRGVAERNDMRKANVEELRQLFFRTRIRKKGARQIFHFNPPRKRQRIILKQRVIVSENAGRRLVARLVKNLGRLKAGWLVSVAKGVIKLTGAHLPPAWVRRHMSGARGDYIDNLGRGQNPTPSFTIINRAKGISQRGIDHIVRSAVKIRSKAMLANARLFLRGKKKLSDYMA